MAVVKIPRRRSGLGVLIGRNVRVTIGTIDLSGLEPEVELLVEAPQTLAVSRDDEGVDRHVRKQHKFEERAAAREREETDRVQDRG